ncbi:hypothetical protein ACOSQ3_032517 [Xanthoceras sorbifolium]
MASPQPPPITPQTEMPTQGVDHAGYHFQKLIEIMGSRLTPPFPLEGNCGENAGPHKETTSHKRCTSKRKQPLPFPEPFSRDFFSEHW